MIGAGSGSSAASDGRTAWETLQRDHGIQFTFPDVVDPPKPPPWFTRLLHFLSLHADWFRTAGWIVFGLILLIIGYFLVRHLLNRNWNIPRPIDNAPMAAWQPSAERAHLLLHDADLLAGQDRFAEAAHHLLLVSIQEISERRPRAVRPSMTSREIAVLPDLTRDAREVFSGIAGVVEQCLFARRSIGRAEFLECRRAFERFTYPSAWQAAR